MVKLIAFFKKTWNIVCGFALLIITFLTDLVQPPNISLCQSEGGIQMQSLSKYIVIALILILLVAFLIYKKRRHLKVWRIVSIPSFILSVIMFFVYIGEQNKRSVYKASAQERVIVGHTLLPSAQYAIDSFKIKKGISEISDEQLVESLGEPHEIWTKSELEINSQVLVIYFLIVITLVTAFILTAIQAVYCASQPNEILY